MRYVATFTSPEGFRDERIFDMEEPKPGEPKHPSTETLVKVVDNLLGKRVAAEGMVTITCNSDPAFRKVLS